MLIISRKAGEIIHVGDDIDIRVTRIGPTTVRIEIEAPAAVPIVRDDAVDRVGKMTEKWEPDDEDC